MAPLAGKTLCLLIQLPPSLGIQEGLEKLEKFYYRLDGRFRYAVEVRHKSWFQDLAYDFFAKNGICMVWNQLAEMKTPPIVTADFLYLRFIGDRSIDAKDFGKIQKDRIGEMQYWAREVTQVQENNSNVGFATVAANNHYAGFGPGTANTFRTMLGLPEALWEEKKQATLGDFSN